MGFLLPNPPLFWFFLSLHVNEPTNPPPPSRGRSCVQCSNRLAILPGPRGNKKGGFGEFFVFVLRPRSGGWDGKGERQ